MMNNDVSEGQIRDYIRGVAPSELQQKIEKLVSFDPAFAERIESMKMEYAVYMLMDEQIMRAKMKNWIDEDSTNMPIPPVSTSEKKDNDLSPWKGLAFFLLAAFFCLALYFFVFDRGKQQHTDALIINEESVEEPQQEPITPRIDSAITPADNLPKGVEESTSPKSQEQPKVEKKKQEPEPEPSPNYYASLASDAYQMPTFDNGTLRSDAVEKKKEPLKIGTDSLSNGEYDEAITILRSISEEEEGLAIFEKAQERLAHAYFQKGDYEKAALLFKEMLSTTLSEGKKDETQWHYLLSMLPNYKRQKAEIQSLITEIINTPYHIYGEKAKDLQAQIMANE